MDNEELGCAGSCGGCNGCGGDHNHAEHEEELSPVLTLTDENGNDVQFEKLDVVVLEDERAFLILAELSEDDKEEIEIVILEIKEEDGEEVYDTVVDEELSKEVYANFLKQQGIEDEE